MEPAQRQHRRQLELKPLVDTYFVWVKTHQGEVTLDNNATKSTLRGFCIGKHNWRLIDTIRGAKSSAIFTASKTLRKQMV